MQAVNHDIDGVMQNRTARTAFVLIDGLADIHIPSLADFTPLEAADTPGMDAIAGAAGTFR